MKYGFAGVTCTLSLLRIVPFKWSSPTSLMTFLFVSTLPVASFCPAVGAGEAAARMTEP